MIESNCTWRAKTARAARRVSKDPAIEEFGASYRILPDSPPPGIGCEMSMPSMSKRGEKSTSTSGMTNDQAPMTKRSQNYRLH